MLINMRYYVIESQFLFDTLYLNANITSTYTPNTLTHRLKKKKRCHFPVITLRFYSFLVEGHRLSCYPGLDIKFYTL